MKFRAKAIENIETHTDGIEIGEWVYGYYYFDRADMCGVIATDLQEESGGVGSGIVQCHIKVDYETLGQYTGRKLNKKELYAGDILKVTVPDDEDYLVEILWSDEFTAFIVYFDFGEGDLATLGEAIEDWETGDYKIELVGNKFENPELLKG